MGILDAAGNLVVEYKYDAWGRLLSVDGTLKTTIGCITNHSLYSYCNNAPILLSDSTGKLCEISSGAIGLNYCERVEEEIMKDFITENWKPSLWICSALFVLGNCLYLVAFFEDIMHKTIFPPFFAALGSLPSVLIAGLEVLVIYISSTLAVYLNKEYPNQKIYIFPLIEYLSALIILGIGTAWSLIKILFT